MDPEVEESLTSLNAAIDHIEATLKPYLDNHSEWERSLDLNDRARLDVMAAYSVVAMHFVYLQTQNQQPNESFLKLIGTVREYLGRVKDVEDAQKKRPKINKTAAKRIAERTEEASTADAPPTSRLKTNM
eukprot:PhM_4_TR2183/c0_g1_i1/m.98074/K12592/C1D, LRP1; exosome complex protein LRP1